MSSKLSEVAVASLVTEWVSMADHNQYSVFARAGDVSPRNGVTIQLRKALNSSGSGAVNHGSAVTADDQVGATLLASELGVDGAGVQYTHVAAIVTDQDSPNSYTALALRSSPRSAP